MRYKGRPSYASLARRHGELNSTSKDLYHSIMAQVEAMNPNDHIIVSPEQLTQLNLNVLRVQVSIFNKQCNTNFKVHKHKATGDLYIWYCPDAPAYDYSKQPASVGTRQTPGSIHAPLPAILAHLNMTKDEFDALAFDTQMTLRIRAGIALRDERIRATKLNQIFKRPDQTPDQ